MSIRKIEDSLGLELPADYKLFLGKFNHNAVISFKSDWNLMNRSNWTFVGPLELCRVIDKSSLEWWQILMFYKYENKNYTKSPNSLAEIDEGLVREFVAIAYDEGDIIFMDARDKFNLGIYLHDVNEIELSDMSVTSILTKMKLIYSE